MKNMIISLAAALALLVSTTSCKGFNKDELKGDVAQEMDGADATALDNIADVKISTLTPADQAIVADKVYNYFKNKVNVEKIAKTSCHAASVASSVESNAGSDKCEASREECLAAVKEAKIEEVMNSAAEDIKTAIKRSKNTTKQLLAAFKLLNDVVSATAGEVDCGMSKTELETKEKDILKKMADKNITKEKANQSMEIIHNLLKPVFGKIGEKQAAGKAGAGKDGAEKPGAGKPAQAETGK